MKLINHLEVIGQNVKRNKLFVVCSIENRVNALDVVGGIDL